MTDDQTSKMAFMPVSFELKREPTDDGVIEGYASTFEHVDEGMDVISHGAFTDSLNSGRKVRMLWQHNMAEPIGVWDEIREDEKGLYVKGRVSKDVRRGQEAIALYRMDAMDSLSIGYRVREAVPEGAGRVRRIVKCDLFEISAVTIPMNSQALASVKSIDTERQFESFLRDAGWSRKEATAISLHGFKAITGQRDAVADEELAKGIEALSTQIRQLQRKVQNV